MMSVSSYFQVILVVTLVVEAAFWGVHCIAYAWSMHALVNSQRPPGRVGFWGIATCSTLLWLIGTADMIMLVWMGLTQLVDGALLDLPDVVIMESVSRWCILKSSVSNTYP
jgi:hypothetical protein